MTNEEKKALTGLCKIEIKRWRQASESNPNMRYMVELMEIALAALTAQPVKLPEHLYSRLVCAFMMNEVECKELLADILHEVKE